MHLAGKHALALPASFVEHAFRRLRGSFGPRDLALLARGLERLGHRGLHPQLEEAARLTLADPANLDSQSRRVLRAVFKNLP